MWVAYSNTVGYDATGKVVYQQTHSGFKASFADLVKTASEHGASRVSITTVAQGQGEVR